MSVPSPVLMINVRSMGWLFLLHVDCVAYGNKINSSFLRHASTLIPSFCGCGGYSHSISPSWQTWSITAFEMSDLPTLSTAFLGGLFRQMLGLLVAMHSCMLGTVETKACNLKVIE